MYIWSIFDTATGTRSKINSATLKPKRKEMNWKEKEKIYTEQKETFRENQSHVLIDQCMDVVCVCCIAMRCCAACNVHTYISTVLKIVETHQFRWMASSMQNEFMQKMWATCWLAGVCDKITERNNPHIKMKENIRAGTQTHIGPQHNNIEAAGKFSKNQSY